MDVPVWIPELIFPGYSWHQLQLPEADGNTVHCVCELLLAVVISHPREFDSHQLLLLSTVSNSQHCHAEQPSLMVCVPLHQPCSQKLHFLKVYPHTLCHPWLLHLAGFSTYLQLSRHHPLPPATTSWNPRLCFALLQTTMSSQGIQPCSHELLPAKVISHIGSDIGTLLLAMVFPSMFHPGSHQLQHPTVAQHKLYFHRQLWSKEVCSLWSQPCSHQLLLLWEAL